jgi:hypothetical protein
VPVPGKPSGIQVGKTREKGCISQRISLYSSPETFQTQLPEHAMEFTIATKKTAHNVEAFCKLIGCDLLVALWGGEKPHIGAVAVACPRPSAKNTGGISASASVICLSGHQEDELARKMALSLASALNKTVVVSAGMHWNDIGPEGILDVIENCKTLTTLIIDRFTQAV